MARNGISECELLKIIPIEWTEWLLLSQTLHHSCIVVTRMGLLTFSNKQASNGIKKGFDRLTTSGADSVHFKLIIAKSFVKDPLQTSRTLAARITRASHSSN